VVATHTERTAQPRELASDVAGILRVVLHDAEPSDLRAVAREVGDPVTVEKTGSAHVPRLDVSFVDRVSGRNLRLLDGGTFGYTGDGLYALGGRGSPRAWIQQGEAWGSASVVCARGARWVPFLSGALDLAAVAGDWTPLHASAWVTPDGIGVIASGWSHSGKTGALLAACEHGARPIGDDRVLLAGDGSVMVGLGRPVQIKDWHIAQLPRIRATVGTTRAALARAGYAIARRRTANAESSWGRLAGRALAKARDLLGVERDLNVDVGGSERRPSARPRLILLMEAHGDERIVAEPADPDSVAARLAAHMQAELVPHLRGQLAYEYANPGQGWRDVDQAPHFVARILERAVRGLPAWIVRHPYPCSLHEMHEVTSELAASVA
jgi:hypothetical protein